MKSLSAKKVISILKVNGFLLSRSKGSHMIFRHPKTGIMVPVPLHNGNKLLPIGTFLAIFKQSKISKEKFK